MRWFTVFSYVSFCLVSLLVLQFTKNPLCIDSKVVEKIDKVAAENIETIYRCAYKKSVPYSSYFDLHGKDLTLRIQNMERVLDSIEPFYRRVQIQISSDQPDLFKVKNHQILIGEKILEAPGHLEKALAKAWFRERNQTLFAQQMLMEEVITDFLVYLISGDIDIGDPRSRIKTALLKPRWPHVIKSVASYCDSPWKRSEHFAVCKDTRRAEDILANQVTELSLRPLLLGGMVRSYKSLYAAERYRFVGSLPLLLRSEHNPELPMTTALPGLGVPATTLFTAAEAIKNVNAFFSTTVTMRDSEVQRLFVSSFTNFLHQSGFQEAFAEAAFDLLYVSSVELKADSPYFQNLLKLSKRNPNVQMAVRDEKNIWMLPSIHPISLRSFGQIRASRMVVEKCGGYNFDYVMAHAGVAEKLMVVDHCELKDPVVYNRFLFEGAEGFGAENKGIAFIQFHLPSLLMKKDQLSEVNNVFEFIRKRDLENPSFKSLGWIEVHWSKQANAYQPKAFVDAIEWFRMPN